MGRRMKHKINEKKIVDMYKSGISGIKIADELGIKAYQVHYILDKNDIKKRKNGDNFKKYTADYRYFEKIDTEEKAYWLGFIAADGYVTTDYHRFGLALSKKDKGHIEKLRKCMSSNHPICDYITDSTYKKNTEYSRLVITSEELKKDLIAQGIIKNKSLLLEFPSIDEKLVKHYIRGYFDGDGSITRSLSKSKLKHEYQFKVMGTREFLTGILEHIKMPGRKLFTRHNDDKNTFYISIGGNIQVEKLLDYLYEDATVYLDRKHQRYKELKAQSSGAGMPQSITL